MSPTVKLTASALSMVPLSACSQLQPTNANANDTDAAAQDAKVLVTAADPEAILAIAKKYGDASLDKDGQGDPMINAKMDNVRYNVVFYGCENNESCTNIQFRTGWVDGGVTPNAINAWNRDTRFIKTYIDDEGDPMIEMDVNLDYGVTKLNLDDTFDWWRQGISRYSQKMLK